MVEFEHYKLCPQKILSLYVNFLNIIIVFIPLFLLTSHFLQNTLKFEILSA